MNFLKKNILTVSGVALGALAGFFYWKYVGCLSGTCMITSKPVNSTLYGALMGGLFFSIFKSDNKTVNKSSKEEGK
ncbi:MAG: hypothetical protein J5I50_09395 [Chitinophagaceae bacterium]|nr:hypothetical protein [Chitinophagaceae bacterium]